jgi:hypothetical protein
LFEVKFGITTIPSCSHYATPRTGHGEDDCTRACLALPCLALHRLASPYARAHGGVNDDDADDDDANVTVLCTTQRTAQQPCTPRTTTPPTSIDHPAGKRSHKRWSCSPGHRPRVLLEGFPIHALPQRIFTALQ